MGQLLYFQCMTCSLRDNILKFDKTVPRYTSYPTAPNFKKQEHIEYPILNSDETTSLYIHVPFCQSMCWYCGCHTKVTKRYDPIAEYVDFLLKEIELITSHQPNVISVSHIHFGGGSPGMLSPQDFERIMNSIRLNFNVADGAEIAIEIDPRGVTDDRVIAYAKMGVNRVSLGTQDFNDDVMKSVNREQPFDLSDKAVKLFREHGINHFNLDLIYGLPHQTTDKMKRTIALALSLDPNRISLFGYAHVPWMKKHMRLIDETTLPDKILRLDLFQTGAKMLENRGYISIGIDHFVKQNDTMAIALKNKKLKRNFQGYTTDQSNIMIGLGVSSIGKTKNSYFQNHVDMPLYKTAIEEGRLPLSKACELTTDDKIRGEIIERIMCDFEIDLADYNGDYSNELQHIQKYEDQGFLNINGKKISINSNARPIVRLVSAAFDTYLPPETAQKHSRAI